MSGWPSYINAILIVSVVLSNWFYMSMAVINCFPMTSNCQASGMVCASGAKWPDHRYCCGCFCIHEEPYASECGVSSAGNWRGWWLKVGASKEVWLCLVVFSLMGWAILPDAHERSISRLFRCFDLPTLGYSTTGWSKLTSRPKVLLCPAWPSQRRAFYLLRELMMCR